jgi:primosomal protein N' (replication factor Y)
VWAPAIDLDTVVVVDEHDESLQAERVPTWHARDVAVERARRAGARCLLVSAAPSLEGWTVADRRRRVSRAEQRRGWPIVEVIDRRRDDLGFTSLFSRRLVAALRPVDSAVLVLNRKGRARLLACATCGELVRTEDGEQLMIEVDGGLLAPETGERRPLVCAVCTGTTLKRLRPGVTRAAEELSRLLGRPVGEVSADTALSRIGHADLVAFLDFDQELLAPRYRAAEEAMALVVRAGRLCGGRRPDSRILLQTRLPDHRVVAAAVARDPAGFIEAELALRTQSGFPPFASLAEISGPGAETYGEAIRQQVEKDADFVDRIRLLGPRSDGRVLLLVRSADRGPDRHRLLADLLNSVARPKERVRIAVDPLRV